MAVTAVELLDAAQKLLDESRGEVDWRNAISRGYYAAYHRCLALADQSELHIEGGPSGHLALIAALQKSRKPGHRSIALKLTNCRVVRNNADYDIGAGIAKRLASATLRQCHGISALAQDVP